MLLAKAAAKCNPAEALASCRPTKTNPRLKRPYLILDERLKFELVFRKALRVARVLMLGG